MNPKPNVVTERFKFKERRQGNETIIQFVAVLKKMSEFWEFGTHLEDALRDQLIWGIKDQNIQKRLLSEESFNFKRCVELSVAMEAATNDVNQLQNQNQVEVLYQEPKNEPLMGSRSQRKAVSNSVQQKRSDVVCYCCGAVGHIKPKIFSSATNVIYTTITFVCRAFSRSQKNIRSGIPAGASYSRNCAISYSNVTSLDRNVCPITRQHIVSAITWKMWNS